MLTFIASMAVSTRCIMLIICCPAGIFTPAMALWIDDDPMCIIMPPMHHDTRHNERALDYSRRIADRANGGQTVLSSPSSSSRSEALSHSCMVAAMRLATSPMRS